MSSTNTWENERAGDGKNAARPCDFDNVQSPEQETEFQYEAFRREVGHYGMDDVSAEQQNMAVVLWEGKSNGRRRYRNWVLLSNFINYI